MKYEKNREGNKVGLLYSSDTVFIGEIAEEMLDFVKEFGILSLNWKVMVNIHQGKVVVF